MMDFVFKMMDVVFKMMNFWKILDEFLTLNRKGGGAAARGGGSQGGVTDWQ